MCTHALAVPTAGGVVHVAGLHLGHDACPAVVLELRPADQARAAAEQPPPPPPVPVSVVMLQPDSPQSAMFNAPPGWTLRCCVTRVLQPHSLLAVELGGDTGCRRLLQVRATAPSCALVRQLLTLAERARSRAMCGGRSRTRGSAASSRCLLRHRPSQALPRRQARAAGWRSRGATLATSPSA